MASMASRADKLLLYRDAVQDPQQDVDLLERVFLDAYGRKPLVLREDFCGTAAVACEWVGRGPTRKAWAVDLDEEPLAWCREHHFTSLSPAQRQRVHLVRADVRAASTPRVDVVAAQNFSFFLLQTRADLLTYFRAAHAALNTQGVLVLDIMGGPSLMEDDVVHHRKLKGFTYVGDQATFDPITHECVFRIHFHFPDGSKMRNAFEYQWRLWQVPEVREALQDAGFSRSVVYWRQSNPRTGNYFFQRREHAPARPTFLACLVAQP